MRRAALVFAAIIRAAAFIAAAPATSGEAQFRDVYKELVNTKTTP